MAAWVERGTCCAYRSHLVDLEYERERGGGEEVRHRLSATTRRWVLRVYAGGESRADRKQRVPISSHLRTARRYKG